MFEGFTKTPQRAPNPQGKPRNPPSTHLRNLAWLRFLLDSAPQIRAWALGGNKPKVPPAWHRERAVDAAKLRRVFTEGPTPAIPWLRLDRPVALLDELFDDVLHDKHSSSGLWFGDKVVRGWARPNDQRLKWLDDLVPGSAAAFHDVPAGLDPWFYGALDFQSPWYARIHLWRTIDPSRQDPVWEEIASEVDTAEGVPVVVQRRSNQRWKLRASEVKAFRSEIALALAHVLFPEEINNPNGMLAADRDVRAARAASENQPLETHPVAQRVRRYSEASQWAALSDALAALRLEQMIGIKDGVGAWWVRGVVEGSRMTIERRQRQWFCAMPNQAAPLMSFLKNPVAALKLK